MSSSSQNKLAPIGLGSPLSEGRDKGRTRSDPSALAREQRSHYRGATPSACTAAATDSTAQATCCTSRAPARPTAAAVEPQGFSFLGRLALALGPAQPASSRQGERGCRRRSTQFLWSVGRPPRLSAGPMPSSWHAQAESHDHSAPRGARPAARHEQPSMTYDAGRAAQPLRARGGRSSR